MDRIEIEWGTRPWHRSGPTQGYVHHPPVTRAAASLVAPLQLCPWFWLQLHVSCGKRGVRGRTARFTPGRWLGHLSRKYGQSVVWSSRWEPCQKMSGQRRKYRIRGKGKEEAAGLKKSTAVLGRSIEREHTEDLCELNKRKVTKSNQSNVPDI